jgi:hypothetical protein
VLTATGEDFTDGEATGDADVAFTDDLTEGDDFGVIETGTVEGVA